MVGRYDRFDTLAYFCEDNLQFLRFEKNKERGIDYIFKNTVTGVEVNSHNLNMRVVNALHEVINDCWDALQYERVCRGMNFQGGLYRDYIVSSEDWENAVDESQGALQRFGAIGENSSAFLKEYGPYVYAIGELFKRNPNFDSIVDRMKKENVALKDVEKAYELIKERGLSDSWFEGFVKSYNIATEKRQEKADNFLLAVASIVGVRIDERRAEILWKALVEYHDGEITFPSHTHLGYERVGGGGDGPDYYRELFINRLYVYDGILMCKISSDDGVLSSGLRFDENASYRDFMEEMSVIPGVLNPLNVEKDSRGLYIDGAQKKAALDFVMKHGIIKTEKVKNLKSNNVKM